MRQKALVVGAGFGGIAAALRLRKLGYDVDLIDRQDKLGGRAYVYHRNGFTFDAGPTVITAPFLLEELFSLFDRQLADYVNLVPVDPWYLIRFHTGETFRYGGSLEQTLAEIRRFEPDDAAGYLRLLAKCKSIFEVGFEKLGDQPFLTAGSMLRIAPEMIKLESYLTVHQLASRYIKNDLLRRVFSFQPLLVGGNPYTTTSIYSLIHYLERQYGVYYAMGGTGALVAAFGKLLEDVGVAVKLKSTVSEILVENGAAVGVTMEDGETIHADLTVVNADAPSVYRNLIDKRYRKKWTDKRIERMKYSMGLFVLYFGTNKQYPDLAHHTILLCERYKELLEDLFDSKILPPEYSMYLHAPSRTDPTMAPEGCECFYVLVPVPNLQGDVNWDNTGPALKEKILTFLEKTILPGLREHLMEDFYVTPEHFRDNLLSMHGSGFSVQPTLTQSAYFRFHNQSEDLKNLYLVGAGTHPGAGMPGVLCSAKVLENLLTPSVVEGVRNNASALVHQK